jgi:hypothetical protein
MTQSSATRQLDRQRPASAPALTSSLITLLRSIAQWEDGLDFSVSSAHDAKLVADLAELERRGLIKTAPQRRSPRMNSRQFTAMVTNLGSELLRPPLPPVRASLQS